MTALPTSFADTLVQIVGEANVIQSGESLETLSKDFYWYSPVLKRQLDDKRADIVVRPASLGELRAVIACAYEARVPVVPRGGGTGNYGQCVPLYGGVVVDLARLDRILDISSDGVLRCEPGARLGTIEPEARKVGWEMRCLPSTWVKATLGGFFCGGSGGIGSITWGGIAAPGNVKAVTLMTCEAEPRLVRFEEEDCKRALHTYGTTGLMVEIEMRLAPKVDWEQVLASSPDWETILTWADSVARDEGIPKRLVSLMEAPIPSFFKPILKHTRPGEHLALLLVERSKMAELKSSAAGAGVTITHQMPLSDPPKPPFVTDYTWNHTTLWAMKADPVFTYLQVGYSADFRKQFAKLREKFPGEILQHLEWTAGFTQGADGSLTKSVGIGAIPLIRFSTEERLYQIIEYCAEIGVGMANPHTFKLEEGGRHPNLAAKYALKGETDPAGLLNPGKLAGYSPNPFAAA